MTDAANVEGADVGALEHDLLICGVAAGADANDAECCTRPLRISTYEIDSILQAAELGGLRNIIFRSCPPDARTRQRPLRDRYRRRDKAMRDRHAPCARAVAIKMLQAV